MGLLDNLMPGESYGIPNQGGLLDNFNNPLLQIGLGILANNNSKNSAQVIGRGALQGIGNYQQGQQLAQQKKLQDAQLLEATRKQQEYDRQQKALEAFKVKFPEYGEAVELDPKLAIKAAYPQLASNSADPYYTPIATESGLGSFNNRSGKFELVMGANGQPVVKSVDSPLVRGSVKAAEAQAGASYKPNTDIPGVVSTDAQVAQQAYGNQPMPFSQGLPQPVNGRIHAQNMPTNNFNTPYAVTFGAPGTTATDAREGTMTDESVAVRNPSRPNVQQNYAPPVSGIQIQTPAQLAGQKAAAELTAETQAKAQMGLPNAITEANKTISLVDDLLKSPGLKTAVGKSRLFGIQNIPGTDAKDFDIRLDQLKGKQFLQAYESLKGAGAITDIEGTKAGNAIARMDASASEEEFKAAAKEFQSTIRTALENAKKKAGIADSPAQPSFSPPKGAVNTLKLNPKLRDQFDAKYGAGAAAQVLGK